MGLSAYPDGPRSGVTGRVGRLLICLIFHYATPGSLRQLHRIKTNTNIDAAAVM